MADKTAAVLPLAPSITVAIDKPLVRGEDLLASLTFRRPTTVVLLDMSLIQLGLADMDTIRMLLARTSTDGLIVQEVDRIDGADMLEIAHDIAAFFQIDDDEVPAITIDGDIVTIPLVKPIRLSEDDEAAQITQLRLRRPDSGVFRGLSLARLGQMETRSLAALLPRIALERVREAEIHAIDPVDWMRIANEVGDFLLPRRLRTA
jgi:hypothetical protein